LKRKRNSGKELGRIKDAAALALEMGHTDSGMIFDHYRELVKPKDAERFWNIRPAQAQNISVGATRVQPFRTWKRRIKRTHSRGTLRLRRDELL